MAATVRKRTTSPEVLQNYPGGKTTWKAGVPAFGWYKMADSWWEDLARLQRGLYQRMLIEFVWAATVPREEGVAIPEWSPWLSWSDMAARFRCSPDQLRDDARDAAKRSMIAVDESQRGKVRFQVLWAKWSQLKDYTPPKPVSLEKAAKPKVSSHWFSKRVTVAPGESYDFTVPDLPADFTLQKISFRNTGDSESVTIAGGGPADGGVIVLETEAEKSVAKKDSSEVKRESTPQTKKPRNEESTPQTSPASRKIGFSSPLAETLAKYGILSDLSVNKLVADCQAWAPECSLEEIEQAARAIGDDAAKNPKTRSVAAIVLTQVPNCFKTGSYQAPRAGSEKKDAMSERERIAWEISRMGRKRASNE